MESEDVTRADFGGTIHILTAVFRVPPGYMTERTPCIALRNF
jgi:hypothetical protein